MTDPVTLKVNNLSFRYKLRSEKAVEDVSFELEPGELLLVAGPSGCGKTTLARCINGLIPRSYKGFFAGSLSLGEQNMRELSLSDISQVVGTLLQDPERQIVGSNVRAEIAFGPENLGVPKEEIEERSAIAAERLGIEYLLERDTFLLSGGEKQKVALAGVLVMQPSVLILDEPLASLDPASAHEALRVFRSLADEGTAILLVEHRVEDALEIHPDRLLYMSEGRIEYLGPVDKLPPGVDHHDVKLPADWVMQRVRESGEQVPEPPIKSRPPEAEPLVSFENVTFTYDRGPTVLHGIDLAIRRGDVLAILGPNGAGKSTLVKQSLGLLKPEEGEVRVGEHTTNELSIAQVAHTVGYVFQSPTHMLFAPSVNEELTFGPKNIGMEPEEIVESIKNSVEAVNLTGLEEYPPLGLSFGQQKRTAIGSVLAMRSNVIILDEPTAGQDFANYTRFMDAMAGATQEGGKSMLETHFDATVFITHDIDLAVTYANRIVLLNAGKIVADGTPEDILCQFDLLAHCRIRPTSLLRQNCQLLPETGRMLPAAALTAYAG